MEEAFVKWLAGKLPAHAQVPLGIGDDAALVRLAERADCVVTSDLLAEGVHFVLAGEGRGAGEIPPAKPAQVGRKALAVNLSDLAAMAARPVAAVSSLLLPRSSGETLAQELTEGMLALAEQFGIALAGGDTNTWDGPLVVSVTALGQTTEHGPLTRSGGQPDDVLLVTGSLGGSLAGKHLDFTPRVAEALLLHERYELHAGMDLSDGLAADLPRLCAASGCGAEVELAALPLSVTVQRMTGEDREQAWSQALSNGEDFELLLAVPPSEAERLLADQPLSVPLTRIGRLTAEPELWQIDPAGRRSELERGGYWH